MRFLATKGGGFDEEQMWHGKMTDFQVWDYALNDTEVKSLPCDAKGNLFTFDDFEVVGSPEWYSDGDFQCDVTEALSISNRK